MFQVLNRRIPTQGVMKFIILVKAFLLNNNYFLLPFFCTKLIPEIQEPQV